MKIYFSVKKEIKYVRKNKKRKIEIYMVKYKNQKNKKQKYIQCDEKIKNRKKNKIKEIQYYGMKK